MSCCYMRKQKDMQGYISAEEFMNIPELSINPLAQRLERVFESVNFKVKGALLARPVCPGLLVSLWIAQLQEFVYLLSAFSSKTAVDDKIHFIFTVYDSDGDGLVSSDDMELMLRQLAGSTLRLCPADSSLLLLHDDNVSTLLSNNC